MEDNSSRVCTGRRDETASVLCVGAKWLICEDLTHIERLCCENHIIDSIVLAQVYSIAGFRNFDVERFHIKALANRGT